MCNFEGPHMPQSWPGCFMSVGNLGLQGPDVSLGFVVVNTKLVKSCLGYVPEFLLSFRKMHSKQTIYKKGNPGFALILEFKT